LISVSLAPGSYFFSAAKAAFAAAASAAAMAMVLRTDEGCDGICFSLGVAFLELPPRWQR
jgi:hypothetical protein